MKESDRSNKDKVDQIIFFAIIPISIFLYSIIATIWLDNQTIFTTLTQGSLLIIILKVLFLILYLIVLIILQSLLHLIVPTIPLVYYYFLKWFYCLWLKDNKCDIFDEGFFPYFFSVMSFSVINIICIGKHNISFFDIFQGFIN
jgi:hypothetical protein